MAAPVDVLVVEDGTGIPLANCYCNPLRALYYHSQRGMESAWQELSDHGYDVGLLIEATRQLDAKYTWLGSILTTTQGLALPRDDITLTDGRVLDGAAQVALAADACAWLALRLYSDQSSSGAPAQSESLGAWSTTYSSAGSAQTDYSSIDAILAPIIEGGGFGQNSRGAKLVRWS